MKKHFFLIGINLFLLLFSSPIEAQDLEKNKAPQLIKSIQLRPLKVNTFAPLIRLGESISLSFDDLEGDEKNYTYTIVHCDIDWQQSRISSTEYLNGLATDNIRNYKNAFNTYQAYTHYELLISGDKLELSGNYIIQIKDDLDELIFTRRFMVYEPKVTVGVSAHKSRVIEKFNTHQNLQFTVNTGSFKINNPSDEIKINLYQNNDWNTLIKDIKPQFYSGTQLLYKYTDKSLFEGGNEFLFFDTKNIRTATNNVYKARLEEVYHSYLYLDEVRKTKPYTYYPDINGNFVVRMINDGTAITEADYSWVHFSLKYPFNEETEMYVYGSFNDWQLTNANKMTYNKGQDIYEAKILFKQGFYNYKYVTKTSTDLELNTISGSFYQTENKYTILVYFSEFGSRYDRLIGIGEANSKILQN